MRIVLGGGKGARCVYCRDDFDSSLDQIRCRGCNTVLHRECRDELSRCPTLGCRGRWSDQGSARPTPNVAPVIAIGAQSLWRRIGSVLLVAAVIGGGWFVISAGYRRYVLSAAAAKESEEGHIDRLIALWEDGDESQRRVVRRGLESLPYGAIHELLHAFGDQRDTAVRAFGAEALAAHVRLHPYTLDALVRGLGLDRSTAEQRMAARALGRLRPVRLQRPTRNNLQRMLHNSPSDRSAAAEALVRHDREPSTITLLANLIHTSNDQPLATKIATGLAELDGAAWSGAPELLKGLYDRRPWVQKLSALALRGCGVDASVARERLLQLADSKSYDTLDQLTAMHARETLKALGELTPEWLLSRSLKLSPHRRAAVFGVVLGSDRKTLGATLDRFLESPQPERLRLALEVLIKLDDEDAHWALLRNLARTEDPALTRVVLEALMSPKVRWTINKRTDLQARLAILEKSMDRSVQRAAEALATHVWKTKPR